MIQAMDGPPDHEEIHNNNLLDELEKTSKNIKDELADCKEKLIERLRGNQESKQSRSVDKDRILIDEAIKGIFASCED